MAVYIYRAKCEKYFFIYKPRYFFPEHPHIFMYKEDLEENNKHCIAHVYRNEDGDVIVDESYNDWKDREGRELAWIDDYW